MFLFLWFWGVFQPAYSAPIGVCNGLDDLIEHRREVPKSLIGAIEPLLDMGVDSFHQLGGDSNKPIRFAGSGAHLALDIPIVGESWKPLFDALAALYWPAAVYRDFEDSVYVADLEGAFIASFQNNRLRIGPLGNGPLLPEFARAENNPGCVIVMDGLNAPLIGGLFGDGPVALAIPFDGTGLELRAPPLSVEEMAAFQRRSNQTGAVFPHENRSLAQLTLGSNPALLLSSPIVPESMRLTDTQSNAIDKQLFIPAGGTVSIFQLQPLDFDVHLPILNWCGKPMAAWQIWWGLKRAVRKQPHRVIGKRRLEVMSEKATFHLSVGKGRVSISTSLKRLEGFSDLRQQAPRPESFDAKWPFSMRFNIPSSMVFLIGPLESVWLGIATDRRGVVVGLQGTSKGRAKPESLMTNALLSMGGSVSKNQTAFPIAEIPVRRQLSKLAASHWVNWRESGQAPIWKEGGGTEIQIPLYPPVEPHVWVSPDQWGFRVSMRQPNGSIVHRNRLGHVETTKVKSTDKP